MSWLRSLLCRWFGWGCSKDVRLSTQETGLVVGYPNNVTPIKTAADTGVGWIRLDCYWYNHEPERGEYDWSKLQHIINQASHNRVNIYVTIHGTPYWARKNPRAGPLSSPKLVDWEVFVRKLVNKFSEVDVWGIWNEPNSSNHWTGTDEEYWDLVRTASPLIRNAGALCAAPEAASTGDGGRWVRKTLKEVENYINILSVHHYGYAKDAQKLITSLDSTLPVWLTETGYGPNQSEQQQAKHLKNIFHKQSQTPQWEVTMPYHWYLDPPYTIKDKKAEKVIIETIQ